MTPEIPRSNEAESVEQVPSTVEGNNNGPEHVDEMLEFLQSPEELIEDPEIPVAFDVAGAPLPPAALSLHAEPAVSPDAIDIEDTLEPSGTIPVAAAVKPDLPPEVEAVVNTTADFAVGSIARDLGFVNFLGTGTLAGVRSVISRSFGRLVQSGSEGIAKAKEYAGLMNRFRALSQEKKDAMTNRNLGDVLSGLEGLSGIKALRKFAEKARAEFYRRKGPEYQQEFKQILDVNHKVYDVIKDFDAAAYADDAERAQGLKQRLQDALDSISAGDTLKGKNEEETKAFYGGILYRSLQELRNQGERRISAETVKKKMAGDITATEDSRVQREQLGFKVEALRRVITEIAPSRFDQERELRTALEGKILALPASGSPEAAKVELEGSIRALFNQQDLPRGMSVWYLRKFIQEPALRSAAEKTTDLLKKEALSALLP